MICPSCKGTKEIHGLGCPGFKPITLPCDRCGGKGEVPNEMARWIKHGEKLRQARIKSRRIVREEAALRGVGCVEWSRIEFGKVDNLKVETLHG